MTDETRRDLPNPLPSLSDGKTLDENGAGQRLTLVKKLGEGGMGVVWLARDSQLTRLVAIKRPKGAALTTQTGRARFLREARTAAQLSHPNIVTIHQVGEDAQGPFIEMEYVEGYSLREEVKHNEGGLEAERVIEIGIALCDALALAHQRGIIHRDIKPANILMTPRGLPKLGDFGLAAAHEAEGGEDRVSMTGTGAMLGTLYYVSPEQIKDAKKVDARSDVYSLGATLYFAAVGEDPRALYFKRVPEALRPILEKALEENPTLRFASMEEFARALQSAWVSSASSSDQDARCPKCKSPNPLTARHCVSCGASLADLFKKCPECQTENRVDQKFCQGCGADLLAFLEGERLRAEIEKAQKEHRYEDIIRFCDRGRELLPSEKFFGSAGDEARKNMESIRDLSAFFRTSLQLEASTPSAHEKRIQILEKLRLLQPEDRTFERALAEEQIALEHRKLSEQVRALREKRAFYALNGLLSAPLPRGVVLADLESIQEECQHALDRSGALRAQARLALEGGQYDAAIEKCTDGLRICSDDKDLENLCSSAEAEKKKAAQDALTLEKRIERLRANLSFHELQDVLSKPLPKGVALPRLQGFQEECQDILRRCAQLRAQAQESIARHQYDTAIRFCEEGQQICADDKSLQALRAQAEREQQQAARETQSLVQRVEHLRNYLAFHELHNLLSVPLSPGVVLPGLEALQKECQAVILRCSELSAQAREALSRKEYDLAIEKCRAGRLLCPDDKDLENLEATATREKQRALEIQDLLDQIEQSHGIRAFRRVQSLLSGSLSSEIPLRKLEMFRNESGAALATCRNLEIQARQALKKRRPGKALELCRQGLSICSDFRELESLASEAQPQRRLLWKRRAVYSAIIMGILLCLVIAKTLFVLVEESVWNKARRINSKISYEQYLEEKPNGKHRDEALAALENLDQTAWEKAAAAETAKEYSEYLKQFPDGRHKGTAAQKLAGLDDQAFGTSVRAGTAEGYAEYLSSFPAGRHSADAQAALLSMAKDRYRALSGEVSQPRDEADARRRARDYEEYVRQFGSTYWQVAEAQQKVSFYEKWTPLSGTGRKAGEVATADLGGGVKMDLAWVPAGSFEMGSPDSESDRRDGEGPVHTVELDGFWMGEYEVTQEQYEAVMGNNPSNFKGVKHPVEKVSWNDATDFCRKASQKTEKGFRLPTEAEWEYACRAGSSARFCFGDSDSGLGDYAWYKDNSGKQTHPVGRKTPNACGLYDMHGNVLEWCGDRYANKYDAAAAKNPQGPSNGEFRISRGGSCYNDPSLCRSAYRDRKLPAFTNISTGFRVVCGGFSPR